ncbi:MAG: T9SS type A sorting domain-containing protein [Bacteroidota bacterium]
MKKRLFYFVASFAILLSVNVHGQPPGWAVNPSDYANSMTFTWQVDLPDGETIGSDDYLAAFVDGECRGVVSAIELNESGEYYFLLLVHSNSTVGDQINFRFYDASAEDMYDYPDAISFESEKIVGSFSEPNQFIIEPDIVLNVDDNQQNFQLYPNPAEDYVHVKIGDVGNSQLQIVDLNGAAVSIPVPEIIDEIAVIDLSQIKSGIYYIIINSQTQYTSSKLIKL